MLTVETTHLKAGYLRRNGLARSDKTTLVDHYNTFVLGANVAMSSGTTSDALYALDPTTQKVVTLRVPYPRGFFTRGLDGRIDDAGAGWKGRGLWAVNGSRATWHTEGGKGPPARWPISSSARIRSHASRARSRLSRCRAPVAGGE